MSAPACSYYIRVKLDGEDNRFRENLDKCCCICFRTHACVVKHLGFDSHHGEKPFSFSSVRITFRTTQGCL